MVMYIQVVSGIPGNETRPSLNGPGPDQPVGSIKLNYLTDDHLKVNNQFNNIGIAGEPSRSKFIVINILC